MNSKDLENLKLNSSNPELKCGDSEVLVVPPNILHRLGYDFGTTQHSNVSSIIKDGLEDISSNCNSQECYKDKTINSDQNSVTSKLCIQGVEKPGGELFFLHSEGQLLKTYSSNKQLKPRNKIENCIANNIDPNLSYKIDYEELNLDIKNIQNFCICNDFGTFTYYEENNSYQHIHFWKPMKDCCSLEVLLSIYEDEEHSLDKNIDAVNFEDNILIDLNDEVNELNGFCYNTTDYNIIFSHVENVNTFINSNSPIFFEQIGHLEERKESALPTRKKKSPVRNCLHDKEQSDFQNIFGKRKCKKILSKRDGSTTEYINGQNSLKSNISREVNCTKQMSKTNSGDQNFKDKMSNKRKRSFECYSENYKPSTKKALEVKCGICKTKTTNVEWEDHACNEHDFIAWREGETIDLEDKQLFKKLTKRLLNNEKLICTFCGTQVLNVKEFINHVGICMNRQVARDRSMVCGVCDAEIVENLWLVHICKEHNYLAWERDSPALDINDEDKVCNYLNTTSKAIGGLVCSNCGTKRKNVKSFIYHLKTCANIDIFPSEQQRAQIDGVIDTIVKCGVCQVELERDKWLSHISTEHNYLAWMEGESPLDFYDSAKIKEYLQVISKDNGGLICSKCGCRRRYVKSFLTHIENCDGNKDSTIDETLNSSWATDLNSSRQTLNESSSKKLDNNNDNEVMVECGVCHEQVEGKYWYDHIQEKHEYIAWKEGETPINVNDPYILKEHLYVISKANDGLICGKCGCRRKYLKGYLSHIKKCDGSSDSSIYESLININDTQEVIKEFTFNHSDDSSDENSTIKCGVCYQEVEWKSWHSHIQKQHSYLAWKDGEEPIDFNSDENVYNYLYEMSKKYDGLKCKKCGVTRKYVKVFLDHIKTCESTYEDFNEIASTGEEGDSCQCGVCSEMVEKKDWRSHAMKKHYNIAWVVGDYALDVKNPSVVEKYLKEYKNVYKTFTCTLCGLTRASNLGFYAHIIQCGKTEEEIEMYKNYCDVCDNKYLCIYKSQHIHMHKDGELAKERKLSEMKKEINGEFLASEGRMAAKKARHIIEKYRLYEYNCAKCDYGADEEKDLEYHNCGKMKSNDHSGSEVSVKLDEISSEDSEESEIDSNVSEVEVRRDKKKKHGESVSAASRIKRVPFEIRNAKVYLQQTAGEYFETYYTDKTLYPQWLECKYIILDDHQMQKYMPPLDESCKLSMGKPAWMTLKKFEAIKQTTRCAIFVGSCIQGISWAPPRKGDSDDALGHYLAVSCHNGTDIPRLLREVSYENPNMIQIWDFGDLKNSVPKFVLGIAHNYGIVWGLDWCPSGAREVLTENLTRFTRLGLLAIACSNGSAYILSVPYPSTITVSEKVVYKLTPVAELKLSEGARKSCQATSISWCSENGHSTVMVGYSDGTTALYDMQTESPLLKNKKEDINIFYPYHDERPHNTTVTGVATFPLKYNASGILISSASPTGAESLRRGNGGGARLRSLLPASAASYLPHWPTALVAENDSIVNSAVNELDWWCVGRRLGAVHSSSGCLECGVLATYVPPMLRIMKPHPVYTELDKEPIAVIKMVPIGRKQSKQKNDDLAMKIEPLTYDNAIKSYGIEFKFAKEFDKKQIQNMNNEQYPERFPLSDVPSMAFNLSSRHHRKLALATHAGFVIVINT